MRKAAPRLVAAPYNGVPLKSEAARRARRYYAARCPIPRPSETVTIRKSMRSGFRSTIREHRRDADDVTRGGQRISNTMRGRAAPAQTAEVLVRARFGCPLARARRPRWRWPPSTPSPRPCGKPGGWV